MQKLIMLELNEVNFEFIERYIEMGELPNFDAVLRRHGYSETISEDVYENIEPWIQWVSAHTGKSFAEHQVFRLGDIQQKEIRQIWEHLEEECGLAVAAISPMNAVNNTKSSAFFVPDPWTGGHVSGPPLLARMYDAISASVNQNAGGKMGASVYLTLLLGLIRFGRIQSAGFYASCVARMFAGKWRKALILDRLLADTFLNLWRRSRPDYSTLFVNAAAHIQHHYMFNSSAYEGVKENPEWYVKRDVDPLLEVYKLYDHILSEVLKLGEPRIMIATGLHQDPHAKLTYYYRLANHSEFLGKLSLDHREVETRMSRDFFVSFDSIEDAERAGDFLRAVVAPDGESVFYVENRGANIFVMLTYANEIGDSFDLHTPLGRVVDFKNDVVFVAIKNGEHNGVGYFVDTGINSHMATHQFPITEIFEKTLRVFQS